MMKFYIKNLFSLLSKNTIRNNFVKLEDFYLLFLLFYLQRCVIKFNLPFVFFLSIRFECEIIKFSLNLTVIGITALFL